MKDPVSPEQSPTVEWRQRPKLLANVRKLLSPFQQQLVSADELKQFAKLQANWERLQSEVHLHGISSARNVILEASEKVRQNPSAANIEALKNLNTSAADLQRQHNNISSIVKRALGDLADREVWPCVQPIYFRAAGILDEIAAEHESREREFSDLAGVPFQPSETLLAVQYAAEQFRLDAKKGKVIYATTSPRAAVANFFDLPSSWEPPTREGRVNMNAGKTSSEGIQDSRRDAAKASSAQKSNPQRKIIKPLPAMAEAPEAPIGESAEGEAGELSREEKAELGL